VFVYLVRLTAISSEWEYEPYMSLPTNVATDTETERFQSIPIK